MRRLARTRDSRRNKKTHWGGKMENREMNPKRENTYLQQNGKEIPQCYIRLAQKLAEHGCGGKASQYASLIISIIKE